MYSKRNTWYTSKIKSINKKKLHHIVIYFILILTLCGCKRRNDTVETNHMTQESIDTTNEPPTYEPTASPTLEPTPTIKPSASIKLGEEISAQVAQALLEEQIDTKRYFISLLSEDIVIDGNPYIAFIATQDSIPLEPIIIVNKYTGKISCMSSDGKCIAFSNFPFNTPDYSETDWSGTYHRKGKSERTISTLQITQNDPSSFDFMIHMEDSSRTLTLAGIGHIEDNYAFFVDENDNELVFVFDQTVITIHDDDGLFTQGNLDIAGSYLFESIDITEDFSISKTEALTLISNLSTSQSKLPAEMSEYTLRIEDSQIIVGDRICHVIGTYAKLGQENVLVKKFYVSIDGQVTFSYDNSQETTDIVFPSP